MNFVTYDDCGLADKQAFGFEKYFKSLAELQLADSDNSHENHAGLIALRADYLMKLARYCYLDSQDACWVELDISYESWQTPFFSRNPFPQERKCRSRLALFRKNQHPLDVYTYNGYFSFLHEFGDADLLYAGFRLPVYHKDPDKNDLDFQDAFLKLTDQGLLFAKNPVQKWLHTMFPNEGQDMMFVIVEGDSPGSLMAVFSVYEQAEDFRESTYVEHKRVPLTLDQLQWQPYSNRDFYQALYYLD